MIECLEEAAIQVDSTVDALNWNTYRAIKTRCQQYFHNLVPNKELELIVREDHALSEGLEFVVKDKNGGATTEATRRSVAELSGGQKALLGLAFVFACAAHRPCKLYLMDEVDAALDEGNQEAAGRLMRRVFSGQDAQLLATSHHRTVQTEAQQCIPVIMQNRSTLVGQL